MTKIAAHRAQRSTSTIARKIGDCEQSRILYPPCSNRLKIWVAKNQTICVIYFLCDFWFSIIATLYSFLADELRLEDILRELIMYSRTSIKRQVSFKANYPFPRRWPFNSSWGWTVWFGLKYVRSTLSVAMHTRQTFQLHACKVAKLSACIAKYFKSWPLWIRLFYI